MEQTISVCPQQDNFCAVLWAEMVLVVKNMPANARDARDVGLIPVSGRCSGKGNCNSLQYSCLRNHMNRGAWWETVHGRT